MSAAEQAAGYVNPAREILDSAEPAAQLSGIAAGGAR